jgi:hypothetical protein
MRREGAGVGECDKGSGEAEALRVEGLLQLVKQPAPEEAREHAHGEEEAGATRDPLRAVRREAPTGHDAVQMEMVDQRLSPGVQHGEDADRRTEMGGSAAIVNKVSAAARKRIP